MESIEEKAERMHKEALRELMKLPPIQCVLDSTDAFLLVMNLQLALTHPNNQGEGGRVIQDIARKLQIILGKQSRKAFDALELGWENKVYQNNQSQCKACGAPIVWVRTKSGKWTPQDLDGGSHWATCPEAHKFKKGKTTNGKNNISDVAGSSNRP